MPRNTSEPILELNDNTEILLRLIAFLLKQVGGSIALTRTEVLDIWNKRGISFTSEWVESKNCMIIALVEEQSNVE